VRSEAPGPIVDWLDEQPRLRARTRPWAAMASALDLGFSRQEMRERLFSLMAQRRVDRGRALLSSAGRIVSDRLHVHILCVLMNIPHVSIDNNYGKIHAYVRDWTSDCPLVQTATTAESALTGLAALPAAVR
jgi:exopolysaccharide biosynthesis predicted pyruvyltransferase EpsI